MKYFEEKIALRLSHVQIVFLLNYFLHRVTQENLAKKDQLAHWGKRYIFFSFLFFLFACLVRSFECFFSENLSKTSKFKENLKFHYLKYQEIITESTESILTKLIQCKGNKLLEVSGLNFNSKNGVITAGRLS